MKKSVNLYFKNNIDTKNKIILIKNLGYDEFFTGIYDKVETINFVEQIKFAKSIGLDCTMIHCSYKEPELNNFWLEKEKGEEITNDLINQIELCHDYSKNFVVHLNGSKESITSEIGLKRILKILQICEKYDINLCVENLYSDKEIPFIFENIQHKNLKICFDYGHQNFLTPNFDIMKNFGEYVSVLHIHDNFGSIDEHLVIGKGNINWDKVAEDLKNRQDLVLSSEIKIKEENYQEILKENLNGLELLNKKIIAR